MLIPMLIPIGFKNIKALCESVEAGKNIGINAYELAAIKALNSGMDFPIADVVDHKVDYDRHVDMDQEFEFTEHLLLIRVSMVGDDITTKEGLTKLIDKTSCYLSDSNMSHVWLLKPYISSLI